MTGPEKSSDSPAPGDGGEPELGEPELAPGLYLVATPIGNLEDITLRALRVLRQADCIACEDTRQTQKLLNHFGIHTRTISCHEHNEVQRTEEILGSLREGGRVAVASDAGMPGISDPGMHLAQAAIEAGFKVVPVPGANAALSALVASGLETGRFLFAGFLPSRAGARRAELERLVSALSADEPLTLIFYEAPHRIVETLLEIERIWGASTPAIVARELTKWHEEFLRGSAEEVRAQLEARERVRGEIVLLVEARRPVAAPPTASLAERVDELARRGGLDRKEALKQAARERGLSRSEAYRLLEQSKRSL